MIRWMRGTAWTLLLTGLALVTTGAPSNGREPGGSDLATRLQRFVPARVTADLSGLPESELGALNKIIEASRLLDDLFLRQAYRGNPGLRSRLVEDTSEEGVLRLALFDVMRGPWDRQEHWAPFAIDKPHPPGAGFYPEEMTVAQFERACEADPGQAEALRGLFTAIEINEAGRLIARPYSSAYATWLKPAARLLEEAADLTRDASLERFLRSRARAFLSDDYYQSDKDWMDLDSRVEVTIGPYEVYEDELFGYKASFESFVTVSDPEASAQLERFKSALPRMEQHLPIPDRYKVQRGSESPIRVVDLVFSAGDARTSVQTIAFNLPNDERVRAEKGAKKVLLRNLILAKFDLIMQPIAKRVLAADQLTFLSSDAFFHQTLFHELSHSLGPAYVESDAPAGSDEKVEVRIALGPTYSAIEECKADVMGAYNILFMIEEGVFPERFKKQLLASYFLGLFRSVRFGLAEAHGQGAAIQINTYLRDGAARLDAASGRLSVDFDALVKSNTGLLRELLLLQARGDRSAAERMLAERARMSPVMNDVAAKLQGVPVDLRPVYPVAGETGG